MAWPSWTADTGEVPQSHLVSQTLPLVVAAPASRVYNLPAAAPVMGAVESPQPAPVVGESGSLAISPAQADSLVGVPSRARTVAQHLTNSIARVLPAGGAAFGADIVSPTVLRNDRAVTVADSAAPTVLQSCGAVAGAASSRPTQTQAPVWINPFESTNSDSLASELPNSEIRRVAASLHLLSLFGGPDKPNGLDKKVIEWGASIAVYDMEISESHDLVDEGTWEEVRCDLSSGKSMGRASPRLAPPFRPAENTTVDRDRVVARSHRTFTVTNTLPWTKRCKYESGLVVRSGVWGLPTSCWIKTSRSGLRLPNSNQASLRFSNSRKRFQSRNGKV